jgi:NAD(P)-dependent dehydrogenase (short-subunit alcohol dehydrogenase family)
MDTLAGKGAVVTGGASGIGLETARRLAARGARVVLADVEAAALDRAVDDLRSTGSDASGVQCDVSSLANVTALADESFRLLDQVHIVFNNAGVALGGPIASMTHDDWRWVIDVDLWGPIHGVEAFLPRLIEQGNGGHLLFTASFAGLVPNVGLGPYCVAKYGVVALAEVLARELRSSDIGVSVLCPMRVGTNIGSSERNRGSGYGGVDGGTDGASTLPDESAQDESIAGRIIPVDVVADMTVDAILNNRLYVLPHEESRESIRRRFDRIDRAFDSR